MIILTWVYDDNSMTMRVNLHDLDIDDQNITDSYLQNMIMTLIIEILVIIIIFMIVSSKSS